MYFILILVKTSVLSLTLKILMMLNILFEISLLYASFVEKIYHMAMIYIVPPSAAVLCTGGIVSTSLLFIFIFIADPLSKKIFDNIVKSGFFEIKTFDKKNIIGSIFVTSLEFIFKEIIFIILRPVLFLLISWGVALSLHAFHILDHYLNLLTIVYKKVYFYFYAFTDIKPLDIMYY